MRKKLSKLGVDNARVGRTRYTPETEFSNALLDAELKDAGGSVLKLTLVDDPLGTVHVAFPKQGEIHSDNLVAIARAILQHGVGKRVTIADTARVVHDGHVIALTPLHKLATGRGWFERRGFRPVSRCEKEWCDDSFADVRQASMSNITRFAWECLRPLLVKSSSADGIDATGERHGETLARIAARITGTMRSPNADDMVAGYRQYAKTNKHRLRQQLALFLQRHGMNKDDAEDALRAATPAQIKWFRKQVPLFDRSDTRDFLGATLPSSARARIKSGDVGFQDSDVTATVLDLLTHTGVIHVPQALEYTGKRK